VSEPTQGATNALQKRAVTVREWMAVQGSEIAKAVPKHIDPVRFARVALTTVLNNPKLLECSRESLMACVMQTAAWGLDLDPVIGEAYMVPFNERGRPQAKLIIGYQGLVQLARRSKEVRSVTPRAVYDRDTFTWEYGLDDRLIHKPFTGDTDPGKLIAVYAVALLSDGTKMFDVMTKREVDAIRARSRAGSSGPWVTDYEAMAKKTVVRRLCKYLPKSVELATAIRMDEATDSGDTFEAEFSIPSAEEKPSSLDKLTERIGRGRRRAAEPPPDPPVDTTTGEVLDDTENDALDRELFPEGE